MLYLHSDTRKETIVPGATRMAMARRRCESAPRPNPGVRHPRVSRTEWEAEAERILLLVLNAGVLTRRLSDDVPLSSEERTACGEALMNLSAALLESNERANERQSR